MLYLKVKFRFFPTDEKAFLYFKFANRFVGIDNFKTVWRSVIFAIRIFT